MSLNMFWFYRPTVTGIIWERKKVHVRLITVICNKLRKRLDRLGYTGVLIPTGRSCEDAWLVAASMIPVTQRLKFLVALRPSVTSPTVAARQAATLDRLSNGRALFNLVTGSDPQELAGDGVFLDHSERYEASAEFTRSGGGCCLARLWISTANIFMYAGPNCSSRRFNSLILRFTLADRQMSPRSWRQNKLISTLPGANHRNW